MKWRVEIYHHGKCRKVVVTAKDEEMATKRAFKETGLDPAICPVKIPTRTK